MEARETTANKEFDKGHFQIIHVYEAPKATLVIDKTLENAISVEPNPNSGFVRVRMPATISAYTLTMMDISGKTVLKPYTLERGQSVAEIIMHGLPSGQYFLNVQTENKVAVKAIQKM